MLMLDYNKVLFYVFVFRYKIGVSMTDESDVTRLNFWEKEVVELIDF